MKITLKEMNGLLNGKCLPSDLIVGETLAEYLVRKFTGLEQKLAESQREFRAADATIENLQMQVETLAAEAQGFKRFFLFAINAAFDGCDITGDQIQEVAKEIGLVRVEAYSAEKHAEMSGDPSVMEEGDDFYIMNKTPATDTFLAEVRASAIPEGYVLVPQQIFLEPSDIESICSQCGDGHESGYGDFTDGLLWVGNIQRDDGSIVHGLHISSADYSEEGGVTVCEFADQLRKGVQS